MAAKQTRIRWPYTTTVVLAVTAAVTTLQFFRPAVLTALERTPEALRNHQYWRLLSPILVHSDGWKQIAFNFPTIAVVGYFVERIFGGRLWLVIYLLAGLVGNIAGYAWQPAGAGASVAGAGLLGALALSVLLQSRAIQPKFGALLILGGAACLTAVRNIHGPPVFAGVLVASVAIRSSLSRRKS